MGGLSFWHVLLLLVIVLLLFGPSRLPGLGRSLGEAIRGFKRGLKGDEIDVTDSIVRHEINESSDDLKSSAKQKEKDKEKV